MCVCERERETHVLPQGVTAPLAANEVTRHDSLSHLQGLGELAEDGGWVSDDPPSGQTHVVSSMTPHLFSHHRPGDLIWCVCVCVFVCVRV